MHIYPQPTPLALPATPMRAASAIASAAIALLGGGGLAVSVVAGGFLADARAAYIAGLAALILATLAVLVVGGTRGMRGIVRDHIEHRAAIRAISVEIGRVADVRTDRVCRTIVHVGAQLNGSLQDRLNQLEAIVACNNSLLIAQAERVEGLRRITAGLIDELHRRELREQKERDELERRRNRRGC